jgi:hypothetical protein
MKEWKWEQTWGWDYPMTAMTAARLGETGIARKEPLSPERSQLAAKESALLFTGQRWIALRRGLDGGRLARRSDVARARFSIGRLLDGSP